MILYNILLWLFVKLAPVLAVFSPKLRDVYSNRKGKTQNYLIPSDKTEKRIWFHCSSYGEFEGILPLLIDYSNRNNYIIVSFFSSSGFDPLHTHPLIDYCCYLPFDTTSAMKKFISSIKPDVLLVSQNEYWPNMIRVTLKNNVPIYFISTYVRPKHWWLKKRFAAVTHPLKRVDQIFLQDKASFELLAAAGYDNISMIGNTRIDQVILNSQESKDYPRVREFVSNSSVVIAGSTLTKDEDILFEALQKYPKKFKLILVPHDPHSFKANTIPSPFQDDCCLLSSYTTDCGDKRILVVDSLGDLKYLYRYAHIAFIGGGFDAGVHSVLEAAVYKIPIITGPNISKFQDAVNLAQLGILTIVHDPEELTIALGATRSGISADLAEKLRIYLENQGGSTQRMLDSIRF